MSEHTHKYVTKNHENIPKKREEKRGNDLFEHVLTKCLQKKIKSNTDWDQSFDLNSRK